MLFNARFSQEPQVNETLNWNNRVDANLQSWSDMDTPVLVVTLKCKLIPSIITVAFIVLGKWTKTLGFMQMLTAERTNKLTNKQMENQIPLSSHTKSSGTKIIRVLSNMVS